MYDTDETRRSLFADSVFSDETDQCRTRITDGPDGVAAVRLRLPAGEDAQAVLVLLPIDPYREEMAESGAEPSGEDASEAVEPCGGAASNAAEPSGESVPEAGTRPDPAGLSSGVWDPVRIPMHPSRPEGRFLWVEAAVPLSVKRIYYRFEVESCGSVWTYDRRGLTDGRVETEAFSVPFVLSPVRRAPAWAEGAVMYQIFVDRFRNGDPGNDVVTGEFRYEEGQFVERAPWDSPVRNPDVNRFYGGDLAGVIEKLGYLQDLGVDCLYLNPIFVSPSNHKYDSQDYEHVDPHFGRIVNDGTEEMFEQAESLSGGNRLYRQRTTDPANLAASDEMLVKLIEEAHRRGIRVILDGVFNHCGSFHKWMDREGLYRPEPNEAAESPEGAYHSADSPYRDYFRFERDEWPENDSYEGWWGYRTLPKLNYEGSKQLQEEILRIGEKWVSAPYGADGWRLDVAADLGHDAAFNHRFWKKFRERVRAANPDAIVLAEHYGNPRPWLTGGEWDTVMNYDAFMEPVSDFLTGMEKHSDQMRPERIGDADRFFDSLRRNSDRLGEDSLLCAMNELSNHDHSRFLTRTNGRVQRLHDGAPWEAEQGVDRAVFRLAVLLQFTLPGAPTIYYGDEAGLCGFTDPDSRRPFPWGHEDWEMVDYHRNLAQLHRGSHALRRGSTMILAAGRGIAVFGRMDASEAWITAVNRSEEEQLVSIPAWRLGGADGSVYERVLRTDRTGYSIGRARIVCAHGQLETVMAPKSGILLRRMS